MLQVYVHGAKGLQLAVDAEAALRSGDFVWADLHAAPETPALLEGEQLLEATLGIDVPNPAERRAFEESARFYEDKGALVLNTTLMGQRSEGMFVADAVSFILHQGRLVTVRTIKPRAFTIGEGRASARVTDACNGGEVLMALLEGVVERIADVLQEVTTEANQLSSQVFVFSRKADHRAALCALGTQGSRTALSHESLTSLHRLCLFSSAVCASHGVARERFEALLGDIRELERQADSLQAHVGFLLQAALGLVGASQNDVLRAVALATIAFAPPTLVASIFGMNFTGITWFHEPWGAWAAGALMLAAPLGLFIVARLRGWF